MELYNVFSVLIGAIIGSFTSYFATYYAVTKSEQKKMAETVSRLHCLLILEVWCHQTSLASEIDRLLPRWLEKHNSTSYQKLKYEICIIKLPISYFKEFLGNLIHSPLLLGIANYYRNVEWLNQEGMELEQDKNNDKLIHSYIRGCSQILEASIYFMDDLLETKEIERYENVHLKAKRDDFKHGREYYLKLVASIKGQ
ncbi:MAG: hypothetical protein D0528_02435 [Methylococcales bacterium]|nr:MAG: hypothetical protein D0528_02435 [Methylococcales bacterium]